MLNRYFLLYALTRNYKSNFLQNEFRIRFKIDTVSTVINKKWKKKRKRKWKKLKNEKNENWKKEKNEKKNN